MEKMNQECQCAEQKASQISMPRLGEKAPEFTANTTNGKVNFPADYKGKWVILFSHPGDFTPVCTTEFMTFAAMQDEFRSLNCELIGLSVDSVHAHIAWLRSIPKLTYNGIKNIEPQFPIIDDVTMNVARKYGMIQQEGQTAPVRAVFIISPDGIVKAMIYYPASLGRNFDEIKRALIALQTAEEFGVATPADWRPGMPTILGAPSTLEAAEKRKDEKGLQCQDWFFCFKELDKDEIMKKIKK